MENYLYKYGDIEVYNKFQEPTRRIFHRWRKDFLNNVNLDNYNICFRGNAAERIFGVSSIRTYDIDIILSGEIDSYQNLYNIFNTAFNIGLEYNLCIDIFHIDKDVFTNKWWGEYNQIRFYDKTQVSGEEPRPIKDKVEDLPFGLYKFKRNQDNTKSYKKMLSRTNSNQYLTLVFDFKTMKLISFN